MILLSLSSSPPSIYHTSFSKISSSRSLHSNTGTTFQIHKFHFEVEGYSSWVQKKKRAEGGEEENEEVSTQKEEANEAVIESGEDEANTEFRRLRFRQEKVGGSGDESSEAEKPKPRFIRKWTLRQDFVRSVKNLISLHRADIEDICPKIFDSNAKEIELDLIQDPRLIAVVNDYKRFLRTWGTCYLTLSRENITTITHLYNKNTSRTP